MKTHWTAGLLLCTATASANAQMPNGKQASAGSVGVPSLVMPVAIQDEDRSSTPHLRDVLRRPLDTMQETSSAPHRLSLEERHRLREQLRTQLDANRGQGK